MRFGTDGVRGRAHDELTLAFATQIGAAAARQFAADQAVIGCDTRESSHEFTRAIAAGFAVAGVTPIDLGVVPTPAVAHLAARRGAIGAMISASHNPWFDNGIKLFTPTGSKLSDAEQHAIETALARPGPSTGAGGPVSDPQIDPGIESGQRWVADWVDHVKATAPVRLDGLSVVVDAANGAASHVVAPALADLGAQVNAIANRPDGRNINDGCGSTDPALLARSVVETGADLGIALDGDADRLVAVDHRGQIVDGDRIMAILAVDMSDRAVLSDDTVVVTVMSNLGFHKAMAEAGIAVHVTQVGDRHVLEALGDNGWSFGGEQSGHLIFADLAETGDGFMSAVQLMSVLVRRGASLAEVADAAMTRFPQVLTNVTVSQRVEDPASDLTEEIARVESELGDTGRVLLRASGTEPVIRVMVEAATEVEAARHAEHLVAAVAARYGAR